MSWTRNGLPKGRAEGLLTERVDDETVVYDLETKHVHCLAPLAAAVFEHCDGLTAPRDLVERAEKRLGGPVNEAQVLDALEQLGERDLLERPPLVLQNGGISRRELTKRSGRIAGVALAAPLIASIVAPTAAVAQGYIPTGCTGCGQNKDCASNHCCQDVSGKDCNQTCCVAGNNSCHLTNPNCEPTVPPGCICTVPLPNCGTLQCPPGSQRCCTPI